MPYGVATDGSGRRYRPGDMTELHVPQGTFTLERHPPAADRSLRAWDAADELALQHLIDAPVSLHGTVVVLDDPFGASTVALSHASPTVVIDSYLAELSIRRNLTRNGVAPDAVTIVTSAGPFPDRIDVLVFKVPKVVALLEDQLRRLRPHLHADTVVLGAGMTRHIHTSTLDAIGRVVGPVTTSLARRKARLIHATVAEGLDPGPWPWPTSFAVPGDGVTVVNEAGVFSATSLDIGTRLLLDHVPRDRGSARIVDLGCGNGVVGATAQVRNPGAHLTFVDESYRAVASARATCLATFGDAGSARFAVGDVLDLADGLPIEPGSVDLVLVNPPFHADHVMGDETAWAMFTQSRAALGPNGELWVVGNRHLGYHAKLKRLFREVDLVASTPKFVLLRATKP
jgi:23S rRNA (guanine1835-N2)-methyltransferase